MRESYLAADFRRTVLPREEALRTVHGYLEAYAGRAHRLIVCCRAGISCAGGSLRT